MEHGEDIIQDCRVFADERINFYKLWYKNEEGIFVSYGFTTYLWKYITGIIWTYPAGLVLLAQYASKVRAKGGNLFCQNKPAYIQATRNNALSGILNLSTLTQRIQTEPASESIHKFIADHMDIEQYVPKNSIIDNLDEMISNAFDHSGEAEVSVFGQHYHTKREAIFTVLDLGVGIPNHIRKRYVPGTKPEYNLFQNDAYCIQKATEEGFSGSTPDKNSGVGLFCLKNFIVGTRSNLRIISGSGYYECIGGVESVRDLRTPFHGTIIDFQLLLNKIQANPIPTINKDDLPF